MRALQFPVLTVCDKMGNKCILRVRKRKENRNLLLNLACTEKSVRKINHNIKIMAAHQNSQIIEIHSVHQPVARY